MFQGRLFCWTLLDFKDSGLWGVVFLVLSYQSSSDAVLLLSFEGFF